MNPQTMDDVERSIWTAAYGAAFVMGLSRSADAVRSSLGAEAETATRACICAEAARSIADRAVAEHRRSTQ